MFKALTLHKQIYKLALDKHLDKVSANSAADYAVELCGDNRPCKTEVELREVAAEVFRQA